MVIGNHQGDTESSEQPCRHTVLLPIRYHTDWSERGMGPSCMTFKKTLHEQRERELVELLVANFDSISLVTLVLQKAENGRSKNTEHENVTYSP